MDTSKIQKLIDLTKANELAELTYKKGDEEIVIVVQKMAVASTMVHAASTGVASNGAPSSSSSRETRNSPRDNLHEIKSPLVGTFYAQAAPDEPPFAKVGDKVKKGQVLCILEAMKIMNEIESEVAGEIVEVSVENESLVEFGQVLFRVRT